MLLCVHVPTVSFAADEAPAAGTFWSRLHRPAGWHFPSKEGEIETCTVDWTRPIIFLVRKKDGKKEEDESRGGWAKCFWLDAYACTSFRARRAVVSTRHQRAAQSMQRAVGKPWQRRRMPAIHAIV